MPITFCLLFSNFLLSFIQHPWRSGRTHRPHFGGKGPHLRSWLVAQPSSDVFLAEVSLSRWKEIFSQFSVSSEYHPYHINIRILQNTFTRVELSYIQCTVTTCWCSITNCIVILCVHMVVSNKFQFKLFWKVSERFSLKN